MRSRVSKIVRPSRKPWIDPSAKVARLVGILAHGDQTYGDEKPYAFHLDMVAHVLGHYGYKGEMVQAAYLHDTLEDTNLEREDIAAAFGDRVADLVESVTGVGETRKERNENVYRRLAKYPQGRMLKAADRIANVHCTLKDGFRRDLFEMYQKESDDFLKNVLDQVPDRVVGEYNRLMQFKKPIEWLEEKP